MVTDYLLDVQPGLTKVLREQTGNNRTYYQHGPRGIHGQIHATVDPNAIWGNVNWGQFNWGGLTFDADGWAYMLQDGLGSVRSVAEWDSTNTEWGVLETLDYAPYGEAQGSYSETPFGFTGEITDSNDQIYLRARYYDPGMGVFPSLDPFEGMHSRPMSLNGYAWVEGNAPNAIDPAGKFVIDLNSYTVDYSEGVIEFGDTLFCIGRQAGLSDNRLHEFSNKVIEINGGRSNPAFRWYGNQCKNRATDLPCLAPNYKIKIPNYLDTTLNSLNQCSTPKVTVDSCDTPWGLGDVIATSNALGKQCGEYPPSPPTPTPGPSRGTISGGVDASQFEFTMQFDPLSGQPEVGISLTAEWRCSPRFNECGWFVDVAVVCSVNARRGSSIMRKLAQILPSWQAGLELGWEHWPTEPGAIAYFNSAGISVPAPQYIVLNQQGGVVWDRENNGFMFEIGGGSMGPPNIEAASGASVYLGSDINNIPSGGY